MQRYWFFYRSNTRLTRLHKLQVGGGCLIVRRLALSYPHKHKRRSVSRAEEELTRATKKNEAKTPTRKNVIRRTK